MTFSNLQVRLDDLPRFHAVEFARVDPRYPRIVLGVTLAFLGPVVVAAGVVLLLVAADSGAALAIWFPVLVIAALLAWFSHAAARAIGYAIREHDVIVRSGVFWRRQTVQPIRRIQHVEQHQGPIDKRFGLYELKLFSAGTGHFTFRIPGLDAAAAGRIRRFILDAQQDGWSDEHALEPAGRPGIGDPEPPGDVDDRDG